MSWKSLLRSKLRGIKPSFWLNLLFFRYNYPPLACLRILRPGRLLIQIFTRVQRIEPSILMWPWQKKRDSPGYPLKSISVVNSLPQYGQVTRATGSSAPFTVSYVFTNAEQKEKSPVNTRLSTSCWRESDPWPPHYQCDALPTEPQQLILFWYALADLVYIIMTTWFCQQ